MIKLVLSLIGVLTLIPEAIAQPQTGRTLLTLCADTASRPSCVSFLRQSIAVIDEAGRDDPQICPPRDLDAEALAKAFIDWAEEGSPSDLDPPAPAVARQMLNDVFPCGGE